jgi:hypothetical protein
MTDAASVNRALQDNDFATAINHFSSPQQNISKFSSAVVGGAAV